MVTRRKKAATKKKVTKKRATKKALATTTNQLPTGFGIEADAGAGMEGTDKDSFAIPFLTIVQKMSPQVDETDPKYIEAARPGMFTNTVTDDLFSGKTGVIFLPCAYQRRFLQWAPRDSGGGFKGEWLPEQAAQLEQDGEVVNQDGRLYFPDDKGDVHEKKCDYLGDTRNHFGILVDPKTSVITPALLSLSSTQIKKSKQLMTLLNGIKVDGTKGKITPPTWVNRVLLTTVPESNDKGSWHGVKVELDGFIGTQELYDAGKELHDIIAADKANVNYETVAEQEGKEKF
jgi:hypothetical protein